MTYYYVRTVDNVMKGKHLVFEYEDEKDELVIFIGDSYMNRSFVFNISKDVRLLLKKFFNHDVK